MKNNLNLLRIFALLTLAVGAGCSLDLVLYAGHRNKSVLLVVLFVVWVLSPFVALLAAQAALRPRPAIVLVTLYCLMLFITIASLVGYSGILSPPGAKPAGIFLIIPLLSWALIAIVIPIVLARSRKVNKD